MASIRCFVAIPSPPAVRQRMVALITSLQSVPSHVKWELPEKLHITLKFLGNVDESSVIALQRDLASNLNQVSSFPFMYEGIGAFPNLLRPKIYWIGASRNSNLLDLHRRVEHVAHNFGVTIDERPFHPHVTIGRVRSSKKIIRLTATLKNITFEPVDARCSEVHLVKSDLHPTGSRYSIVARIPLNL